MEHEKEWYVQKHREMWNWIADEIENRKCAVAPFELKFRYIHDILNMSEEESPPGLCFACAFCADNNCWFGCPFNWSDEDIFMTCTMGFYGHCEMALDWKEQAKLARKIANLPVRENV